MKTVICSGKTQASYIIEMFKKEMKRSDELIVINESESYAKLLAEENKVPVIVRNFTKQYALQDANIKDADLFIALSDNDIDNYIGCMMAKNLFGCKRVIATCANPANVKIFKQLGIDETVSSSYLITESIKNASNLEDTFKSLTFEDDLIKIIEVAVKNTYDICNKEIKDIQFPEFGTISAINRKPRIIIPKGKTLIKENDKLIMLVKSENEQELINFITQSKK